MPTEILKHPIHLGLGATAVVEPEFSGAMDWYRAYGERHADDGFEGRLVSMHTFTDSWSSWEMHPNGAEVVLCTAGSLTLHQEMPDGTKATVALSPGQYAINDPGTWHTADIDGEATAVFITSGFGTEIRMREAAEISDG
jgi:quercetin dioxygenase-like cupin family protein